MKTKTITMFVLLLTACSADDGSTTEDPLTSGFIETTESSSEDGSSTTTSDAESSSDDTSESSSEGESSTGEPVGCEPDIREEHQSCGLSCVSDCGPGTVCRESYAGGWLAECETKCADDSQCSVGDVCSANHCVTPCSVDGACGEGFHCYPGKTVDGVQLEDPAHPLPHCMPLKG